MSDNTPDMVDVFETWLDAFSRDLHTAFPGKIQDYNATTNTATVIPLVKTTRQTDDGDIVSEDMPALPNVPILFPRIGPWSWTAPVAAGNKVLVVSCESSIGHLRSSDQTVEPGDIRRHHLAHAVAILGFFTSSPPAAPQNALVIGKDGGVKIALHDDGIVHLGANPADDWVALAAKVDALFTGLKDIFEAWVPVSMDGGAALKAALVPTWTASVASVASSQVKAT